MTRRHTFLLAVVVGTWGSMGCDKAAPTEPSRALAEPRSEAEQPSSLSLAGSWSGTITFHAFDGNFEGFACNGQAPVSVDLDQNGSGLTGRFRTGCAGELEIRGTVDGASLFGFLDSAGGGSLGKITGTVSFARIAFKTRMTLSENSDGSTNRGGVQTVVSSEVELHRQASAERVHPFLAGERRPQRRIDVHR